jgi:hypothetical protein
VLMGEVAVPNYVGEQFLSDTKHLYSDLQGAKQ